MPPNQVAFLVLTKSAAHDPPPKHHAGSSA